MGRLRDASRVLASVEPNPEDVLNGLNDVLLNAGTHRIATVVYALLDPVAQTADIAVAGHVPPVIVPADGAPHLLDRKAWSPLLGLPTCSRGTVRVDFHPSSLLVLYTDGLVEERSGMSDGVQNVMETSFKFGRNQSLEGLVQRLIDARPSGELTDDVAILIARGR
jgi:serine phosphatase RsbU (regulator of sigma subunit)